MLLGCGLRRGELIDLTSDHIQRREDHWAIVDLVGKAGHVRTVPMPEWVKRTIDEWLNAADISQGKLFRCVSRKGTVWGTEITEKVVWHVVKEYAKKLGVCKLAPHDLRRSCARSLSQCGWRIRADPIPAGSRFRPDDREIFRVQTATAGGGERSNRDRANRIAGKTDWSPFRVVPAKLLAASLKRCQWQIVACATSCSH